MIDLVKNLFIWVIVISLAINIAVASINIMNVFTDQSELVSTGKFLESVEKRVQEQGFIIYETEKFKITVVTNEWYEKHKEQQND